jgi:hypothetical protein
MLVDDLGEAVTIHRVYVIILFQRKLVEILVAFSKAYAIGGFARRNHDLSDAELHRRLDNVVRAHDIDTVSLVIGFDEHTGDGGEMHDGIDGTGWFSGLQTRSAEMHGHGIEHLTAVGYVSDEREDIRVRKRLQIEI